MLHGEDPRTSRLHLLDAAGKVLVQRDVPAVRGARFAPDGSRFLLVGREQVQVLRARDGSEIWRSSGIDPPAGGRGALFSADGSSVVVVTQETGGGRAGVPQLHVIQDLDGMPRRSGRGLDELRPTGRVPILDLQATPDGSVCLATPGEVLRVRPEGR